MRNSISIILFLIIILPAVQALPAEGDRIHIITHNKSKVITDPSKGYNPYKSWAEFPKEDISYRKAILIVTYQCPDSQRCGEWDYIDNIYIRRKGSIRDTSLDIELARMISPYGSRFTPDWKFTWKTDITDFSFLLHDSLEIEFNHTGYESNTDRGWLITIDFELTEGTPAAEILGYEKLWTGSFPYGNPDDDIENYLRPVNIQNKYEADFVRLRILQTGHGMDDYENCAEFCNKYRNVYFDGELVEQRQIWRECADNPLFPQAGTWIFDRANWCPGAIVIPDTYDLKLNEKNEHTLNIDMEPYINPNKPSANYVFSSYIFYYKKPEAANDAGIEEIISPSDDDIYSRENPVCYFPKIKIRNNGKEILTSLNISYGTEADSVRSFRWTGNIESSGAAYINLPEVYTLKDEKQEFKVIISEPNGMEDEYVSDNYLSEIINLPPTFDPKLILMIKTNNEASQNYYYFINERKNIFHKRKTGSLESNRIYRDTISFRQGCYEFIFGDTANDGLDFWFNPEGGYGYVRITDINGKLIRAFNSDFGKEIRQQFIVSGNPGIRENKTPILNIFPVRNPGKFFCDIFLNESKNIELEITTEDKKKTVYKKKLKKFKEGMVDIDISSQPDGFYFVNIISDGNVVTKKIKVKRD